MANELPSIHITENQHYVPRFYLKNFGIAARKKRSSDSFVSFYQFNDKLCKDSIPTKSICYKSYFYGEDGKLEKEFSTKESVWAAAIRTAIEMSEFALTPDQECAIKEFLIYQYIRTSSSLNYAKDVAKEVITDHISNVFDLPKSDAVLQQLVVEKVNKDIHAEDLVGEANQLLHELDDLCISVIHFNTTKKLITSDTPVIPLNPFSFKGAGFATVGIIILLPISPEKLIAVYDSKIYPSMQPYMNCTDESDVETANKYQVISAEERIIGKTCSELQLAISDSDVMHSREFFQQQPKLMSSFDGNGTFLGIHAREIVYSYDMNLFKLPKQVKKIPKDHRTTLLRSYSRESWINLLVRVYRIPDLLKRERHLDDSTVKRYRDGNSKLLRFMEDYWNIPMEDRTLSPDFIYKLQTVPTTFFEAK